MSTIITIELWRLLGVVLILSVLPFAVGAAIGKAIGWNQAKKLFAPHLCEPRKKRRKPLG